MTTAPDAFVAAVVAALPNGKLWTPTAVEQTGDIFVFDGRVAEPPPNRYVVVYADAGTLSAPAVSSESDSGTFRPQVTSVAPDREMAAWLAVTVRDGVVDTRLSADGWACGPIRHNYSAPPARDEQVPERPVVYIVDQYVFLASRAPAEATST